MLQRDVLRRASEQSDLPTTAGQLALELMHEIRNPLETLSNLTYLTKTEAEDPVRVRHYMDLANEQMDALRDLVTTSLGFAKGRTALRSTDLVGVVDAAVRIHQRRIDRNQIHLLRDVPDTLMMNMHSGELLQVFSNLMTNALDALPAGGILHVRLRQRARCARILIADNGHGIPRHELEKVWRPFFTTKRECGTGLGLSLSRRIVEAHAGSISVRSSVREGRSGTVFRVSFPA